MNKTVYLRMRHRVQVVPNQRVTIGDVAQVITDKDLRDFIVRLPIHQVTVEDKNFVVIDVMKLIRIIQRERQGTEVQSIGPPQAILQVIFKKKKIALVYFLLIWFLLFVGAGLAIMNFHEDVSMQEVHQKIHMAITGEENPKPLLFQIPYSIGLGLGMILFFNHIFRKRLNEEPSPLEVEMFNYEQNLDQYIISHENSESETKLHGD
ncbi:stage V sporulation protein AA [Bacillus sp. FJAT-45350]|uniref:stage V sporulation protein AA n=1 Tax=Bacillus sp. FJAT-45350 TaxID=2011014 RepID=UPI000BB8F27D|nr:stage V sporulation protein AA [Bacillus sp. FJAT-45350]